MKKLILSLCVLAIAVVLVAQEYRSRLPYPGESRNVAGLDIHARLQFDWLSNPAWVTGAYTITDTNGVLFVVTGTNTAHIVMPNPTNYPRRTLTFIAVDISTFALTNGALGSTYMDYLSGVDATSINITSNKVARAYSSGTNWVVTY